MDSAKYRLYVSWVSLDLARGVLGWLKPEGVDPVIALECVQLALRIKAAVGETGDKQYILLSPHPAFEVPWSPEVIEYVRDGLYQALQNITLIPRSSDHPDVDALRTSCADVADDIIRVLRPFMARI